MKTIKLDESQLHQIIAESVKRALKEHDWDHYNNAPSQEEENFDDELYAVIDNYKDFFLEHGYSAEDFYKWCCDIVKKAIGL